MRITLAVVLITSLIAQPAVAAVRFTGELGTGYDSNTSRSRQNGEDLESQHVLAAAGVESSWRVREDFLFRLQGGVQYRHNLDYEKLSGAEVSAGFRGLYRPVGGFYVPTLGMGLTASYEDSRSGLRDAAHYRFNVHVTEPLTRQLVARVGMSFNRQHAASAVFDLDSVSAVLDLDWSLTPRLLFYVGYQYREGDLVTSGSMFSPLALVAARAVAPDDAYPGFSTARIPADAHIGTLGLNYLLSKSVSLDVQEQFIEAEADIGTRYRRHLPVASLLFRF